MSEANKSVILYEWKYPHGNNKTIYLDIQPVLSYYFDVVYTETLVYTLKT